MRALQCVLIEDTFDEARITIAFQMLLVQQKLQ